MRCSIGSPRDTKREQRCSERLIEEEGTPRTWNAPMRCSIGSPRDTKREQRCSERLIEPKSSLAERSTPVCAASSIGRQLSSRTSASRLSRSPRSSASMYTLGKGRSWSVLADTKVAPISIPCATFPTL